MSLEKYKAKRDFTKTSEPDGKVEKKNSFNFVVQEHHARRLHYDLRLQLGGVLKSWAVPKGVPASSAHKRLAVQTEDHPVKYLTFQGTIPEGNYGAGEMSIFDAGTFIPVDENEEPITEKQALTNLEKGELKFLLHGDKLNGGYVLVNMKKDEKNWLIIKHKSKAAAVTLKKQNRFTRTYTKVENPIKPMLATLSEKAFNDKEWVFEIKWDGYRSIAENEKGKVKLYSRNGIDFEERFAVIIPELKKIKQDCILDGEIVWLQEDGQPDFQQLQNYDPAIKGQLVFMLFDLLQLKGKDTTGLTLLQRKELLNELIPKNKILRYCEHITDRGQTFYKEVQQLGLEGIIAKKVDSIYELGKRSKNWLKIKHTHTDDVIVIGYTEPKGGRSYFGSLILGRKDGRTLKFAGHVGTGFNDKTLKNIYDLLQPLIIPKKIIKENPQLNGKTTWVKPVLLAEIKFTEKSTAGIYRHPVFLRLRDDMIETTALPKKKTVKKEKTTKEKRIKESIKAGKYSVPVTNTDKIFWPKQKITKGDVIAYYDAVSSYLVPHLKNRPLSLKRNPNGIKDKGFYHKDAGENVPEYVKVHKHKNDQKVIDYIMCNNKATLLYLANLGCIEMNPWNNRYNKEDKPDWLALDLDPGDHNTFKQVVKVAQKIKELLDECLLSGYCKTSGASGLHIYIPLAAKYDYDTVKNFGNLCMNLIAKQLPKIATTERTIKKRGKKIYLDYLQNRPGQTLASVYSLRPVPDATVSMPIDWEELTADLSPKQFTIYNAQERMEKKGDLFKLVLKETNDLGKALSLLEKALE